MGQSNVAVAVLDINCVKKLDTKNNNAATNKGEGVPPSRSTQNLASSLPAPVLSMADETEIIPANRKIETQSMLA